MNRIITIIVALVLSVSLWAQTPEKMSYQAVIRNTSNQLVTSQQVGIKISIIQGTIDGSAVYSETQTPSSNTNGLISIEIGSGSVVSGVFSAIDWSLDAYFIKTETDTEGGTNYTITGVSQLLSVPYALHAKTAESISGAVSFNDLTNVPANLDTDVTDDFDGNYNNLTNKPTNVSTFTNDAGYLTSEVDGSTTNEIELPTQTGNSGKYLTTDGSSPNWATVSQGASQLTELSDVNTTTATSGNILVADGADFESVTISNDAILASNGALTIADNSVDGTDIALGSDAAGDVMYYDGTNWIRLAKGTDGQVLTLASGVPTWADASGGGSINNVAVKSVNYTIQPTDGTVISTSGSVVTFTLPSAASTEKGRVLNLYSRTSSITISTSETIYNASGIGVSSVSSLYQAILVSDGSSAWYLISDN